MARRPSRRTQWDSNPQPLNTCVSGGAGSNNELSPRRARKLYRKDEENTLAELINMSTRRQEIIQPSIESAYIVHYVTYWLKMNKCKVAKHTYMNFVNMRVSK